MKRLLNRRFLFWLLGAGVLFYGALSWYVSDLILSPKRRELQDYHLRILEAPSRYGLAIQEVRSSQQSPCLIVSPLPSSDETTALKSQQHRKALLTRGIPLPTWGTEVGNIFLCHGHKGRKEDYLPIAERFTAAGFRCILIDMPAHGEHPTAKGTFGYLETKLLTSIHHDLQERQLLAPGPCFLFGLSQGGSIALQVAAASEESFSAVVSVSTFSDFGKLLHQHSQKEFLTRALLPGVKLAFRIQSGTSPHQISPLNAASTLSIPVMISHGELDQYIPIQHGLDLYESIPHSQKIFRPVPGASHHNVLAIESDQLYPDLSAFYLKSKGFYKSQ